MKKIEHSILFILISCFFQISFSQEIKFETLVAYQYVFQQDSLNIDNKEYEEMLLLINKDKSLFISNSKFTLDTLKTNNSKLGINEMLSIKRNIPKNRIKFEVLKDIKENKGKYYEKIFINTYVDEFSTASMVWNVKNDIKEISGYSCIKATAFFAGRNYIAWFTREIAINDGPYKFKGLPGLIVELYDDKKEHHFLLSSLKNKNINYSLNHRNIIKVNMEEITKVRNNQINNIKNSGFNISPELMKKAKDKLAKINNPIELIP